MTVRSLLDSGASGKAAARDSRLVTSFFDGRRRFLGVALDFSMRETSAECLMVLLSFLEVIPSSPRPLSLSLLVETKGVLLDVGLRRLVAFLLVVGLMGALLGSVYQQYRHWIMLPYHFVASPEDHCVFLLRFFVRSVLQLSWSGQCLSRENYHQG